MSWGVSIIGKPSNVCRELDKYNDTLSGQSKLEYESALDHIKALVCENFATNSDYVPIIQVDASGYGSIDRNAQVARNCNVSIRILSAKLA